MKLPDSATLKQKAADRLRDARDPGKIVLIYAGLTAAVYAAVIVLQYIFDGQISQTGGLHNIGTRSILSTADTVLPILQAMFVLCLDLGFVNAMLRISRGQYASHNSLQLGFDRFWVLLRTTLLQMAIYFGVCFTSFYAALILFMISPFSGQTMDILTPLVNDASILSSGIGALDPALEQTLLSSMIPFFIIYLIVLVVLGAPIYYHYRMTDFIIIDNPGMGAFRILRMSKEMMRGNILAMLRLDLSFWWYYLMMLLATVICYGDVILGAFGRTLPLPEEVSYFLCYFLYLVAVFAINWRVRGYVEATYAAAYDSLRPEPSDNGVVLGNIFQM